VVSIEPLSLKHADRIQALVSYPEILAATELPDPYPEDGAVKWIRGLGKRVEGVTEHGFAIVNGAGEIVGTCGFIHSSGEIGVAEIGCWIGRPYWNRGYATEALRLLLDLVCKDDRIAVVWARTLRSNRASRRVLQKLGFVMRQEVPNDHPKWSPREVVQQYEVRRKDWASPQLSVAPPPGGGGARPGAGKVPSPDYWWSRFARWGRPLALPLSPGRGYENFCPSPSTGRGPGEGGIRDS